MTQTTSESVTFSLTELAKIEEERVREEESQRARVRESVARDRRESEAKKRAEEEARIAATEQARAARAREEAADKAVRDARAKAEMEVARIQAEAKARLDADNATRAHELAVLRVKAESGRRNWVYGLAVALGVALCGGAVGAYQASSRMSAMEQDADRLRESQLSLSREHERARATELGALDLRMAALLARPAATEAKEARLTAEAARAAVNTKAIDHDRLRAFADALDALQTKVDSLEKLAALDHRKDSLGGWAAAMHKDDDGAVVGASARARGADDSALKSYESALDRWQRDLAQSGPRGAGAIATVVTNKKLGPPCDPNVGDPMCDSTGHRIVN